jgi:uncharacterized protein (TIGR02246 family)
VKLRVFILVSVIATAIVFTACQAGGTNKAGETSATSNSSSAADSKPAAKPSAEEIRTVLAAHDKALNDKNVDAIMETFSTDPTTVMMGTGSEEHWMGPQEIRAAYTEIIKDYDAGTLDCNCQNWKTAGADEAGTMAWMAATCVCKDSLAGKSREYKLNASATVAKQNGKWRFVVLHMSNAFQPPVSK